MNIMIKNNEPVKNILLPVLSDGENSTMVNRLSQICINLAIATLCSGKNRFFQYELIPRVGGSLKDLAIDCIADLFENRGGKYIHLNKYFNKYFPGGFDNVLLNKCGIEDSSIGERYKCFGNF